MRSSKRRNCARFGESEPWYRLSAPWPQMAPRRWLNFCAARIGHRAQPGVVLEGEAHLARTHPEVRLIEPARVALGVHPVMHVLRMDEPRRWRRRRREAPRLRSEEHTSE